MAMITMVMVKMTVVMISGTDDGDILGKCLMRPEVQNDDNDDDDDDDINTREG